MDTNAAAPTGAPSDSTADSTARRRPVLLFVLLGLGVALVLAFFVSPLASSDPDGLERVAMDTGFAEQATDHAVGNGPFADYTTAGVSDEGLSTGLAGLLGVVLCFVVGAAVVLAIQAVRRSRSTRSTRSG